MHSFHIVSPVNGQSIMCRKYSDPNMIEIAATAAEAAYSRWSFCHLDERIALIDGFVRELEKRRDAIADAVTMQMGRPRPQADELDRLRLSTMDSIRRAQSLFAPERIDIKDGISRYITRDPVGPCLSICAWNYPVAMLASLVIHPLIAGNVVLLKHAPQTAMIGDFVNEAAMAAGLPVGVLRAIDMTHVDCEAVIASGRFPLVQFIGSTRGGREVARAAGLGMAKAGLELGGNDAAYIRPDAPVARIVQDLVSGSFSNAGQSCCSVERIYVHNDIYSRFLEAFIDEAKQVRLGHPVDSPGYIGPVVSASAAARIKTMVQAALAAGAREVLPASPSALVHADSAYLDPRVLLDVTPGMEVARNEVFGPVVSIIRTSDDDEAVALMNDSDYGLTASIWSMDIARAEALGRRVRSGTFYVNRCDHADLNLPWGGVGQSGIGRSHADEGLRELTVPRAWHVRTFDA